MTGTIISGTYVNGIALTNPATQNPAKITATGYVTNSGTTNFGAGIYGSGASWTVTNYGTIKGGDGIALIEGGSVTNSASGLITGSVGGAISIFVADGSVDNAGTIAGTGFAAGIHLFFGGDVTNGAGGLIVGTAGITGGSDSAGVTVINFGTLEGSRDGGVSVGSGGSNSVTNGEDGLIAGIGNAIGSFSFGTSSFSVTNAGTIEGTGSDGSGILLGQALLINPAGTVSNGVGSVANDAGGLITGTVYGIAINYSSAQVTNSGTIEGIGEGAGIFNARGGGEGVFLAAGGSISNGPNGLIAGSNVGVDGADTLSNSGTIEGTGGGGYFGTGVLSFGGRIANAADGLIAGTNTGVVINDSATGTVENLGTIESTGAKGYGVVLVFGGRITNGGSSATDALIAGTFVGVETDTPTGNYTFDPGSVTNFGTIEATGVSGGGIFLGAGGRVVNNVGGLVAGPAFGLTVGPAYDRSAGRYSGIVSNMGVIEGIGVNSIGVSLIAGSNTEVVNGAIGSSGGQILGSMIGVYLDEDKAAGTIINFGTIRGDRGVAVGSSNKVADTLVNAGRIVGTGGTAVAFGGGNDVVTVDAGAVFTGAVNGGGGTDKIVQGSAGTLNVAGFTRFETIALFGGGIDKLTLKTANFAGVTSKTITVTDGNKGGTVSAAGVAAADRIIVHGGSGNDVFDAGGTATVTGGAGANEFVFRTTGGNTIKDFHVSATNELVFSNAGFNLGLTGGTATPKELTAAEAATLFVANTTGNFTKTSQRLAYDKTTGQLFASSDGSGGTKHLVATLSDKATIGASQLFFIS